MGEFDLLDTATKQGFISAVLVIIYLLVIKLIDYKKENAQIKMSENLTKSINNISDFLSDTTKNVLEKNKEKCKIAIHTALESSAFKLVHFTTSTIINNNVNVNKNIVLANIHNIVNAEFYNVFAILSLYTVDGIKASDYLKKDWLDDIEKDIIDIIYSNESNKELKILSFSNKINIKFQSYETYIINHVIR